MKKNALDIFNDNNPNLKEKMRGLPGLGSLPNGDSFYEEVSKVETMFRLYGNELHELDTPLTKDLPSKSLGGGSPMKSNPFPLCVKYMKEVLDSDNLYEYALAAGDEYSRQEIVKYLINEGFKRPDKELNEDNIIFTLSSTQAFNMICKLIGRPHDVFLMTGPNYGLFTFVPERSGGLELKVINLSEEDEWYVNSNKLSARIDEINAELKERYVGKLDYTPRVVGFLNENPHNPLGKVMNKKNEDILKGIGDVCLEKGIFVVDDIIYRDLTYDRNDLAIPMATYEKYFNNTITISGLSKSYGLASIRAGMIVAPEPIVRGIRNAIFQTMDSSPIIQGRALAGAFNSSEERQVEYEKYFNPLIEQYVYHLEILKVLVNGLDQVKDSELRSRLENDIRRCINGDLNVTKVLEGIPNVDFVNKTLPDSGFFELLDFTNLKGKSYGGRIITSETELLKYMYEQEKIKLILGQSISWPNPDQLIGRVTTALDKDKLINHIGAMNRCLRKLK